MTNDAALSTVRQLGSACAFVCQGDVIWAMSARFLSNEDVNAALAIATACVACPVGWRVTTADLDGVLLVVEVRLDPATVISLSL